MNFLSILVSDLYLSANTFAQKQVVSRGQLRQVDVSLREFSGSLGISSGRVTSKRGSTSVRLARTSHQRLLAQQRSNSAELQLRRTVSLGPFMEGAQKET